MAENRNFGQNPNQNRQQTGNMGSSQERGNQSSEKDLRRDEDLQQDVSIGGNQESGRLGQESLENERMGTERERLGGSQSGSTERGSSGSGSSLGNR